MKNLVILTAAVALISACGSEDDNNCADNTKAVQVVNEFEQRNSYHFFTNTCNNLMYSGDINGGEMWGYTTSLPAGGDWSHNAESYFLTREDDQRFDLFAALPYRPNQEQQDQGADVCSLLVSADGEFADSYIDVYGYSVTNHCYQTDVFDPILTEYLDADALTPAQLTKLESIVLNGNPSIKQRNVALNSSKAEICAVENDDEIHQTDCAN
ncbi:hypothetical protein [Vibrio sp. WXL103]|uniref:hypothetical protein n=1 Tax=Vibrio sp. WXL103 TaxID=3450710 RepID=UPI003EC737F6